MKSNSCEACGGYVEFRRKGSTQGYFCKTCDWTLVTTYIPDIELDDTSYEVSVIGADYRNERHIKAVANVSSLNFLATRKLLQGTNPVVFNGMATKVIYVRNSLVSEGLKCEITPEFRY